MSIATVVLAAGGSTRMGRSKQLLEFRGETLVRRAVRAAVEARLGPVVVVLGAEREAVEKAIDGLGAICVVNHEWAEGMGTSIAAGIARVEVDTGVEGAIVMLADQPMVDASILKRLADLWRSTRAEAAACKYGSTVGVPAVFARGLFARLRGLPASGGAKHVLADGALNLTTMEFPDGLLDIDTPDDYQRLTGPPAAEDGASDA